MDVTNTCGVTSVTRYCLQTGKAIIGVKQPCYTCDDSDPRLRHPPSHLTDFNNDRNNTYTWWQSETMLEGTQFPSKVNLTLNLKKSFDITYVNLRFYSPRPESFAIYKRTEENGPWIPYQYYSASCELTYKKTLRDQITTENEDQAFCTNEFSDISPLTGGHVAFSTLEGRPSMFNFNRSPKLQEWVTATDIKIELKRMNTFGDEVFSDPQVLRSYFYAISDLAVGARCKCNGHASECRPVRGQDLSERLECVCAHQTTGQDCEKCLPFYNDKPWSRATETDAHECQPCNCNGLSDTCEFDPELYRRSGNRHGGRCTNCRDNADGVNCELCKVNHYNRQGRCTNCMCDPTGSLSLQCDDRGQCPCKPGVGGQRCDRCQEDYYNFGDNGCRPCECFKAGSRNNQPRCDSNTGLCVCKDNVDGRQCNKCKPGFFGLSEADPFGCISCFCFGHSSECSVASGYYEANLTSNFETGNQRWTAMDRVGNVVDTQYNSISGHLGVESQGSEQIYFVAPSNYLGDQRFSYNQNLSFDLRLGSNESKPSVVDIILEGSGKRISNHIFAQDNYPPKSVERTYNFRIHENPSYEWRGELRAVDFIGILANLTAIKIRGTYSNGGVGFIDNIKLGTARLGYVNSAVEASNVEQCVCTNGHIGQFCESCVPGYKREDVNGGPFSRCVPCECNNHSSSCDIESGKCICQHNTEGNFCERCARGYYGDATQGTSDDCTQCPCPNGGACIQLINGDVVCTECEEGYGGNLCDMCIDGFSGDPMGKKTGTSTPCTKCTCSGNIDPNAVGNCNTTTGECKKCIRNTGGEHCQDCLPDFYNNTLGVCTACNCYPPGTKPGQRSCDVHTGQCYCQPNVGGKRCDHSQPGFYNILAGNGSVPCECDTVGSLNYTCDERTGQCICKKGVSGRRCEKCAPNHFGHGQLGCTPCNCDAVGSLSQQCNVQTGYCDCKENVDGPRCDRCMENKYDLEAGCLDCPECYNLVQDSVNAHRIKLRDLSNTIQATESDPDLFNNTAFRHHLKNVSREIDTLLREARDASSGDGTVGDQLEKLRQSLQNVLNKCDLIESNIPSVERASSDADRDRIAAEKAIVSAQNLLQTAKAYIEEEGQDAVRQASNALQQFGHNNKMMTAIARNATQAAEHQKKESEMIHDLAIKARETSEEAKRLAEEAMRMPDETEQEIDRLRNEYTEASYLFQNTKLAAEKSKIRADQTKQQALSLLTEAKRSLGDADLERLKRESQTIKDQAGLIKKRAEKLMEDNKDMLEKVRNQTMEGYQLLGEGAKLNQNLDELLSDADYARDKARQAVELATVTLKEANDTLNTLRDFEKLTANKEDAKEAMGNVRQINDTINRAINTTKEAVAALDAVKDDAEEALRLAKDAQSAATMASKEAQKIQEDAENTKQDAEKMKSDAETNKNDIDILKLAIEDFNKNVNDDETNAQKTLTEAAKANQNAGDVLSKVDSLWNLVDGIKKQLGNINIVDKNEADKLDDLEKLLDLVEKEFNQTDVDNELNKMEKQYNENKQILDGAEFDLQGLRNDVKNIEEIKNALPDKCFKDINIEISDQV